MIPPIIRAPVRFRLASPDRENGFIGTVYLLRRRLKTYNAAQAEYDRLAALVRYQPLKLASGVLWPPADRKFDHEIGIQHHRFAHTASTDSGVLTLVHACARGWGRISFHQ